MDLFDNRLNFVADVYLKKTTDLIYKKSLPLSSGYDVVTETLHLLRTGVLNFHLAETSSVQRTCAGT
jgi:hypothetical protein